MNSETVYRAGVDLTGKMVIEKVKGNEFEELAHASIAPPSTDRLMLVRFANVDHRLIFEFGKKKLTYDLGDEPDEPNNIRINMGAYGGTEQASMPPYDWALLSDITNDGTVDFVDYAHLAEMFTQQDDELPADFDRNGYVDLADLKLLAEDWLQATSWYGQ